MVVLNGDSQVQIKNITKLNLSSIVVQYSLVPSDYILDLTCSLITFRLDMNKNFKKLSSDLSFSGTKELIQGDTWLTVKSKLNYNFKLADDSGSIVYDPREASNVDGSDMMNPDGSRTITNE